MSQNLERAVGRLEGKADSILAELRAQRERQDKHDERLDALEKDQHTGKVLLSIIAGIAGFVASNVNTIIGYFKA